MARIALQQISSKQAKLNELSGLRIPKKQDYLEKYLDAKTMQSIRNIYGTSSVHLWGVKYEKSNAWANMIDNNTLVLFRKSENIVMRGITSFKVINEQLAESLWGNDELGETWPLIYFITKLRKIDLKAIEINSCLGYSESYSWQGFNTVCDASSDKCIKKLINNLTERRI